MDAFELTKPILSPGRLLPRPPAQKRAVAIPARDTAELLASARRYVNQLPLGSWAGPPLHGSRWSGRAAAREIERSLWRAAVTHGVAVAVDEAPDALARRLVRSRVLVAPAADGAIALLQVLRDGDVGACDEAAKLADRLVGYVDHRASAKTTWFRR